MNITPVKNIDLDSISKCQVGILNTPIQKLERLSKKLGINLYIKRDDLNGLAFGGNKLRKLDYFIYDAMQQGATRIITYGSNQSNHGRLTAAAAAKFGMKCTILMDELPPKKATGSLLVDRILGADIFFMDDCNFKNDDEASYLEKMRKLYNQATDTLKEKYESKGEKVYIIPEGGSSPIGSIRIFLCSKRNQRTISRNGRTDELCCNDYGVNRYIWRINIRKQIFQYFFHLCWRGYGTSFRVRNRRISFINRVSDYWGLGIEITRDDFILDSSAGGPGYNIPDSKTREYIYLMAREEGILSILVIPQKHLAELWKWRRMGELKKIVMFFLFIQEVCQEFLQRNM